MYSFPDCALDGARKCQRLREVAFTNGANDSLLCTVQISEILCVDPKQK